MCLRGNFFEPYANYILTLFLLYQDEDYVNDAEKYYSATYPALVNIFRFYLRPCLREVAIFLLRMKLLHGEISECQPAKYYQSNPYPQHYLFHSLLYGFDGEFGE